MRNELAHFRERGWFISPQPVIGDHNLALIKQMLAELEPQWRVTEFPAGVNRSVALFLLVLKAARKSGLRIATPETREPAAHAIIEEKANLALAAVLLELDENLASTFGRDVWKGLVLSGCGLGDPAEGIHDGITTKEAASVMFLSDLSGSDECTWVCTPAAARQVATGQCFWWSSTRSTPRRATRD